MLPAPLLPCSTTYRDSNSRLGATGAASADLAELAKLPTSPIPPPQPQARVAVTGGDRDGATFVSGSGAPGSDRPARGWSAAPSPGLSVASPAVAAGGPGVASSPANWASGDLPAMQFRAHALLTSVGGGSFGEQGLGSERGFDLLLLCLRLV